MFATGGLAHWITVLFVIFFPVTRLVETKMSISGKLGERKDILKEENLEIAWHATKT